MSKIKGFEQMRIPKLRELAIHALVYAMTLLPIKSQALNGIVTNPLTGEGIPNAHVELTLGEEFADSTRTDNEGIYQINPTSIVLPKNNINLPSIENVTLTDIQGRRIGILNSNEITRTIPSNYNLPSGTYFLQGDNGSAVQFSTIERSDLMFDPFSQLNERTKVLEEILKSGRHSTSGANEDEYFLRVSDDNIENYIGEFYDAIIPLGVGRDDVLSSMEKNIQLIPNYEMQDWDGDFLEYLTGTQRGGNVIWGDYPENYPINVDLDSVSCSKYCGERAEMYLESIRNALDLWNERTDLDIFNYTNVTEDNRQIRIDYSRDSNPQFTSEEIQDEDGRWRYVSGVIYIENDFSLDARDYVQRQVEHEGGHGIGWVNHSPNEESNMNGMYRVHVSADDGYTTKAYTLLDNNTLWDTYLQE